MDAASQITRGALNAIFNDPDTARVKYPVPILQCVQIKPLVPQPGQANSAPTERYRIVLNDIDNFCQSMMASQANHVIHEGKLVKNCIVRIKQYSANIVKGKGVLVVLDLEVLENLGTPDKLGDPQPCFANQQPETTTISTTNFYGVKQETQQTKPNLQTADSRSAGAGLHGGVTIYPIEALSPYAHKWTIKARVTQKSDIRTWHKTSGEGKLFSVNLLDESGEIKATGFNEQVDQFYDLFQEGSVYFISNPCKVSMAKKQFTNLPNDYELVFERDTVIEKAEDQGNVPQVRFNFCTLHDLQQVEKDATVDVIGVLKDVGEVSQIISKTSGKPFDKREVTIVDDSGFSVRATIWGKTALGFDARPEQVVAFKGMKVSDFGGRSLSLLSSGTLAVDPDIPDAHRLKGWYDASGRTDNFATHNSIATMGNATGRQDQNKTIVQVKDENLGMETQDYFTLQATIVYIKQDNFAYPACLNADCNKKVTDMGDGTWRCEKCDVSHDKPQYRYILSVNVCDHTSQLWLSCFDDTARTVMGMSADELMALKEEDESKSAAAFEAANCTKLTFRCRAKMDTFGEAQRVRYQVMSAKPIDFKSEGAKLAELIKQYNISE